MLFRSSDALQRFAGERRLTLNTLLLGAWAQLLSRYSGETDVVFDTTLALRGDRANELREVVGLCINTVPMRVRVEPETRLSEWLEGLRTQWLAMRPHAWLPLASIHRASGASPAERLVCNPASGEVARKLIGPIVEFAVRQAAFGRLDGERVGR